MQFIWGDFALGGINGITNLPGAGDETFALVSKKDRDPGKFRGWGCIDGREFEIEASTRDAAKQAVEATVSTILSALAAA